MIENWNDAKMSLFRWIKTFISGTEWKGYHGNINNEQAKDRLKDERNGIFLVYDDPDIKGQLLLAVHYHGEVHRVPIRQSTTDGKYRLGEETRAYQSVQRLIERHQRPFGWAVHLQGGRHVTLIGYVYLVTKPEGPDQNESLLLCETEPQGTESQLVCESEL